MPQSNTGINKARIWNAVLYPENMREGWQDDIEELIPLPLAYCIHDKDKDGHDGDRKVHVHMTVVWPNTTTYKHACDVFNLLSQPGRKCFSKIEACLNIRRSYDYLIHDTDNARKKNKHQYDKKERIELNNFDIGAYEQLSQQEKDTMAQELCDFVIGGGFVNMRELYVSIRENFDSSYFAIFKANNAMLARLCKGNFQSDQLKREVDSLPGVAEFETMQEEVESDHEPGCAPDYAGGE